MTSNHRQGPTRAADQHTLSHLFQHGALQHQFDTAGTGSSNDVIYRGSEGGVYRIRSTSWHSIICMRRHSPQQEAPLAARQPPSALLATPLLSLAQRTALLRILMLLLRNAHGAYDCVGRASNSLPSQEFQALAGLMLAVGCQNGCDRHDDGRMPESAMARALDGDPHPAPYTPYCTAHRALHWGSSDLLGM